MRRVCRYLLFVAVLFGVPVIVHQDAGAGGLPDAAPDAPLPAGVLPVIDKVEPDIATPWSYVIIWGANLVSDGGSCSVDIGGLYSYVADCSPERIRAIVPWAVETGDVVVSVNDRRSNVVPIKIEPLKLEGLKLDSGILHVKLRPGADIGTVLASEGAAQQDAKSLDDADSTWMRDWYAVAVADGDEVAKAMAYSRHSEVLYAGPVPLPEPDDIPNDTRYPEQWALPKIGWDAVYGTVTPAGVTVP